MERMKAENGIAKKKQFRWLAVAGFAGAAFLLALGMGGALRAQARAAGRHAAARANDPAVPEVAWKAPDTSMIPHSEVGESIRLGLNIITDTPKYARHYVGNRMNCADCHVNQGTQPFAIPLAGITTVFPAYVTRDGRVITIEHRIQECFERSENGTPPPANSPVMVAIVAYMNWLSKGVPMGATVKGRGLLKLRQPAHINAAEGAKIFAQQCEVCHQATGQGIPGLFPPLWGPRSFNDGAGMDKLAKIAAFVKANMPKTNPGSLTVQQAYDVAAFVTSKPRPHFHGAK